MGNRKLATFITTTQTGCSGVPCAFVRIVGTFLLPCGGGLASALLLRVEETCFFIFSSCVHFPIRKQQKSEKKMKICSVMMRVCVVFATACSCWNVNAKEAVNWDKVAELGNGVSRIKKDDKGKV